MEITVAPAFDWGTALSDFYRATNYGGQVHPEDLVTVATEKDSIVGVGRLSEEEGVLVLRGMMVSEKYHGRGLGTAILDALSKEIGDRTCYCVPYAHLFAFYERVGFQVVPVSSRAQFLQERVASYIEGGLDVILMRKGKRRE